MTLKYGGCFIPRQALIDLTLAKESGSVSPDQNSTVGSHGDTSAISKLKKAVRLLLKALQKVSEP